MGIFDRFSKRPTVAVIRMEGVIAASAGLGGGSINDQTMAPLIERAFTRGKPSAVAVAINSPGGSPVQSALVAARLRRLADEKKIPLYAFCEDVAASGGYWIAVAADEIYADANSIVGSIGVISAGFGFNELIGRYGIERRVHAAGDNKAKLDPFKPEDAKDVAWLKGLQTDLHASFIDHVKARRGSKLGEADVFNGDAFLASRAMGLGLVDGIGHLVPTMQQKFGEKVRFTVTKPRRGLFKRLGLPGASDLIQATEERLIWARYGL